MAMRKSILLVCGLFSLASFAMSKVPSSQAWVREQGQSALLFDYFENVETIQKDGVAELVTHTVFVDRETKQDAFREILTTDSEQRFMISYEVENLQINEKGSIVVDRATKKVNYRYFKEDKWRENVEDLVEPFLVGPMIKHFIQLNETALVGDEKLRFYLGVPYLNKSFHFSLQKDEMKDFEGGQIVSLKMVPTNLLVRAAVKPLYFSYDPASHQVRQIFGKVFLKKRTKDGFQPFMAETFFLKNPVEAPTAAPTTAASKKK
ncbi:MAG: hypothetical protein ABIR96_12530 [Bdellovibrionota bacterium]